MKTLLIPFLALLVLVPSAAPAADKESAMERDLEALKEQRAKDETAALAPIVRRYQQSLELLLRHALQANDVKAAAAIKAEIDSLPHEVAKQLPGDWRLVASTGWNGNISLRADGTGTHAGGDKFQWRVEHGTLYLGLDSKADRFYLPIVDGKLTGMNSIGNALTLTKK
jgi:hypothetical protein